MHGSNMLQNGDCQLVNKSWQFFVELVGNFLSFFIFIFLGILLMVHYKHFIMFEHNPRILGLGPQNTKVLPIYGHLDISVRIGKSS